MRNLLIVLLVDAEKLPLAPEHHGQCPGVVLDLRQGLHLLLLLGSSLSEELLLQRREARYFFGVLLQILRQQIGGNNQLGGGGGGGLGLAVHELLDHGGEGGVHLGGVRGFGLDDGSGGSGFGSGVVEFMGGRRVGEMRGGGRA